ncbi:glycosyltransferase family 1 protein [Coleofasciculus sp.]|uniref:glycosyltransferase family 1 protein n=1 Tax=Coleofasciculus sp. TaxID=3100458 RepID=UPI0039FABF44
MISNQYYVCSKNREPIAWNPWQEDRHIVPECAYFGKVFQAMEESLQVQGLTFYLTWDISKLPSYGQNVVAVVQGDEWCRIPGYFHQVRAVFKCYGTRRSLGCNPLLNPSYVNVLTLGQFMLISVARLPGLFNYGLQVIKNLPSPLAKVPPIYDIPLGYYKQLKLPIKDIHQRCYDVFFAGSLAQKKYKRKSLKYWLKDPKIVSRQKMLTVIESLTDKYQHLKFELSITRGFHATTAQDASSYSEKMMDTKICLVPRGTSFETYRFFEALRYGCVVVTEALPSRWFYNGAPTIQIQDWSELEAVLEKLTNDPSLIQRLHQQGLNWWQTKCSETVVGQYIAETLNGTQSDPESCTNYHE